MRIKYYHQKFFKINLVLILKSCSDRLLKNFVALLFNGELKKYIYINL